MESLPDSRHVVQIIARTRSGSPLRYGSGYLVGSDLVLTADHVVRDATSLTVRTVPEARLIEEAPAEVAWQGRSADIALVRLTGELPSAQSATHLRFGVVTGQVRCQLMGFPRFKLQEDASKRSAGAHGTTAPYRDAHWTQGETNPWSNAREGTLEITVNPPGRDPDPTHSPWEGMSGAAVFVDDVLVGVVSEHHRGDGLGRLAAGRVQLWHKLDANELEGLRGLLNVPPASELTRVGQSLPPPVAAGALPEDVATFTGREAKMRHLLEALGTESDTGVMIHTVDGLPGVGKTALAVRVAHRVSNRFPDGQIFLDLHAHTPGVPPMEPRAALASLLLRSGVSPKDLPHDTGARTQLWRTNTANRRILLLLDDAVDAEQIRPLLPGAGGSLVLITSRQRLIGLEDAVPTSLEELPPEEACELFIKIAKRPELDPADPAVVQIARLCGHLPLAIRMVAARLPRHTAWQPEDLLVRFTDAGSSLGALREQEDTMAAAFELSYRDLSPKQQRLFRLFGASPALETDAPAAAALLDTDAPTARRLLEDLDDQRLIDDQTTAHGRYRMHPLLRELAAGHAAAHPDETDAAIDRLLTHYQRATIPSSPADHYTADIDVIWARSERENLLGCLEYAKNRHDHPAVVALTNALAPALTTDGPWQQAEALLSDAVAAARCTDDRHGESEALFWLGAAQTLAENLAEATRTLEQARAICQEHGFRRAEAHTLAELGEVQSLSGEFVEAVRTLEQARTLFQETGFPLGEAQVLTALGEATRLTGGIMEAEQLLEQARAIYQEIGYRHGEANTLVELVSLHLMTEDHDEAGRMLEQARTIYQDIGHQLGEANTILELGTLQTLTEDYAEAARTLKQALDSYKKIGHQLGEANTILQLGEVQARTKDYAEAARTMEQARTIYRRIGHRLGEANAILQLGDVKRRTKDFSEAARTLEQARTIYHTIGDRHGEANALLGLGRTKYETRDFATASRKLEEARTVYKSIGYQRGEAEALMSLGIVQCQTHDYTEGAHTLEQARVIYRDLGDQRLANAALFEQADARVASIRQRMVRKVRTKFGRAD